MADRKPRGELAELTATLQNLCMSGKRSDKELRQAKKEAFKKVINCMTLGMDMSSLFPITTSCANLSPDDIVLKKMLYLYITHYATQTPDLALLTINQLHKDCQDQDPTVRGLALRSLCSLRVANFLEYVLTPISTGLEDRHSYVRRTAVLGVLKVYHIEPAIVGTHGMLEKVRHMLYTDVDPQVVANCLTVMMQTEDREQLGKDKNLIYHLLNRIKDFADWSQCQLLELAALYRPSSEAEVYDIMNVVEDRMSHANSGVVMATIKLFLHLTLQMHATHQQVLERIKDPLKTLISRDDPAVTFAVLSHVLLIVQRAPIIFEQDYVSFYCRTHDPSYVKRLKMEILSSIATSSNVYEIVGELTEYARDINPTMAREAVKAVGRIALSVPDVHGIVERLLVFLETGYDHIMAETLIQMKDLLRRYPDLAEVVTFTIAEIRPVTVTEPAARAALVWMLGQFGGSMRSAPYNLEPLAEEFSAEPVAVRLALLTAGAQLFFKRPPEAQRLLGSLLAAGLNDTNQEVHDRALLYYRLLRYTPKEAQRVIAAPLEAVNYFSEDFDPEVKDKLFQEFNSLSVIYQAPASTFLEQQAYHQPLSEPDSPVGAPGASPLDDTIPEASTNLLSTAQPEADLLDLDSGPTSTSASLPAMAATLYSEPLAPAVAGGTGGGGLLDLDMDLGVPSTAAVSGELQLNPAAKISPQQFQERWRALPAAHQQLEHLTPATVTALAANGHKDFCAHMKQAYIMEMASGGQAPTFRYYFYAQAVPSNSLVLVEMLVATQPRQASITMKAEDQQLLPQFIELWSNCLMGFFR